MAYPDLSEFFSASFEPESLTSEEQELYELQREYLRLREFNRIVMDVFWSAAGLAKTCDQETLSELLPLLIQTLESQLKESSECP